MFDIKYELDKDDLGAYVKRNGVTMDAFDVHTDLSMIPKLLRSMAVLQGKLELTPELQKEREDILAWLLVHHK